MSPFGTGNLGVSRAQKDMPFPFSPLIRSGAPLVPLCFPTQVTGWESSQVPQCDDDDEALLYVCCHFAWMQYFYSECPWSRAPGSSETANQEGLG